MTSLLLDLIGATLLLAPFAWVLVGGVISLAEDWCTERRYQKRLRALRAQRSATDRLTRPE